MTQEIRHLVWSVSFIKMPGSDLRRIGKQSMLKISARTTNGTWLPETDMLTAQSNAAAVSMYSVLAE